MKEYSYPLGVVKIILLVLLVLVLIVGGIFWFDFLGLINLNEILAPVKSRLFATENPAQPLVPTLLDSERLEMERQAVAIQLQELENTRLELEEREAEIEQIETELQEKQSLLDEKEKSLIEATRQYDNKIRNIEQVALYLASMPPDDAVAIMNEYEIFDLVDLLRVSERLSLEAGEQSLVPYWISQMPDRVRAARIQNMLVEKPGLKVN